MEDYNLVWIYSRVEAYNSVDLKCTGSNDMYTVSSSGRTWTLHITNSQMIHSGYYSCCVYKVKAKKSRSERSRAAKVTIMSSFNTSVTPDRQQKTVGQSASFTCGTNPVPMFNVTFFWSRYLNDSWIDLPSERFDLSASGKSVTILELTQSDNGTYYACNAYNNKSYFTMYSKGGYLIVNAQPDDITVSTASQETQGLSTVDKHLPRDNHQPISPHPNDSIGTGSTPSPQSITVNTELDIDLNKPSNGSLVIPLISVVITVFLLLTISSLCFFVLKGIPKSKSNTIKETRTHSNRKPEDRIREGETNLRGQISLARLNPALCSGEGSTETTVEAVVIEVSSDVHQQTEIKRDQDTEDKPLSTKTDGSVRDGEKRNDTQNHPESMYAVVDKSRSKSKKSGTISTGGAPWIVSGGEQDESKLNCGTNRAQTVSSCSKHELPSEHQKSTVAVKDLPVPGRVVDREPSGQNPPLVIPYHLSKRRASTATQAQTELEQTADRGEDGLVEDDPRQRNVEGLIYADLDLSRGSARIINPEEETVYADIGSKKTVG